jgi:hypothetical protein
MSGCSICIDAQDQLGGLVGDGDRTVRIDADNRSRHTGKHGFRKAPPVVNLVLGRDELISLRFELDNHRVECV